MIGLVDHFRSWPEWRGKASLFRVFMVVLWHMFAVLALASGGPMEIASFIVTSYVTLQFGLVLGYHRLLSHRCFATYPWMRRFCGVLGALSMQSGPVTWVAMHRVHHQVAERELDPHSPRSGLFWAHMVWTLFEHPRLSHPKERARIARDVQSDPVLRFCEEEFVFVNAVAIIAVLAIGMSLEGPAKAWSLFLWVVPARVVCLWHITFLTNSVGHTYGYRNFDTPDNSRNVWLLGMLALGDGWHNNHHAFPACAAHGRRRWFEIDPTYRLILILESCGLAWKVRHVREVST